MKPLLTIYFYFNKIFRSNSCDFYKIKSWLFTLGVITLGTTAGWGQTYTRITSMSELTDGVYLIIGDGSTNDGIMSNSATSTPYIEYTPVANPSNTITTGFTSDNEFTITVSGGTITIHHPSVGYVSWGRNGATGNNANFRQGAPEDHEKWTYSVSSGLWTLTNLHDTDRSLQWNNSAPRFACYTSNQVKLKLYKLSTPICTPTASISSFSPTSGPAETMVTIIGSGFSGATAVKFGATDATSFTVIDDNTITAKVPSGINVTETITVFDANNCEEVSNGNFLFSSENNGCGGTSANFTDLFISEIYDSDGGSLGYIELFNPTNAPINLGANDYMIYRFGNIQDGDTPPPYNPGYTIPLTGTVAPYETFVIRFGSGPGSGCSSSSTPNHNQTFGTGFNEKDRFFLMKNGVKVDDVSAPNNTGYSITRNPDASAPSIASTVHPTTGWSYTNDETCSDIGNYDFTPLPTISITHPNDVHEFSTPASLSMSVTSTGGTNTVYQWYFYDPMTNSWMTVTPDNLPGSLTVSGANTENLVISGSAPNIDGINNYQFYCNILDETCEIPSNAALFTIDNPLPIELTSFSAICDDKNESLIQWTTATETNNDYFVIEKSTDGKEWNLVEEIQGKGNYNFPSNYSIKDRNTSNFVTYYRLTQVDFNGDTETFHPISLVCQATGVNFQVFPNPANDFTTVSLQGYNFQNSTLDLRTIEGKLIQRNLVFENTNSIHLNVNLNSLSQGIYLLHWTDGNGEKEVRKIVVK